MTEYLYLVEQSTTRGGPASSTTDIIEVVELSDDERSTMEPSVIVAPVVPLTLIEPVPADDDGPEQIDIAGGRAAWGIGAVKADTSPYTGAGVSVAVIDTGIDADHPAFAGLDIEAADFVSANPQPGQAPDHQGHGTHCAGTIFGRDVDGVRIGVAPGVTKALIAKVFAPGKAANTLQLGAAINWAVEQGADIISMSLGMDFPGYVKYLVDTEGWDVRVATSKALRGYSDNVVFFSRLADSLVAARAFGQPVTVVAASGNESQRKATKPVSLGCAPPASATGIHAIGAVGRTGDRYEVAPFSNADPACVAPGVSVLSAKRGGGLVALSGTSMATPHAAGVLALHLERLWAQNRGDRAAGDRAIGDVLAASTTAPLVDDWTRSVYGAGLAQAPQ